MKRVIFLTLSLLLLFCFASCGAEEAQSIPDTSSLPEETASEPSEASEVIESSEESIEPETVEVLFIGNSFTYYNELSSIFESIAQSAGVNVHTTEVSVGSARLDWFCDPAQAVSRSVTNALESTTFDFVFLQEHSTRPYKEYASFTKAVGELCTRIREKSPDANIYLYETWGFAEDNSSLTSSGMTTKEQEQLLIEAYEKAGTECALPVSYAGIAHYRVYKETALDPYGNDRKHPSYAGSFAAALTHFYTLFPEIEKEAVTFAGELSEEDLATLRDIAYAVAHNDDPKSALEKPA